MKLFKKSLVTVCLVVSCFLAYAQDVSFIALGDMHYDKIEYHDLNFVMTRPPMVYATIKEYTQYTAFMPKFLQVIKKQTTAITPTVKAVVQLGDLVEGNAGNEVLAKQMDLGVVDMLDSIQLPVSWVLVKGNHDVGSPGQPEAWEEVIRPFIEHQVGKSIGHGMYTYKISDNVEFFVLDQFFSVDRNVPETDMVAFLEKELKASTAKYKFVLTHQPIVPINYQCEHLLSGIIRPVQDTLLRDRFLNLLAKHKVIVLCGHLHQYSVLSRNTKSGNIVQVMINSINRSLDAPVPKAIPTEYKGEKWLEEKPDWEPATKDVRTKILTEEKKHILKFSKVDLPGYAVISISDSKGEIYLNYYNGLSEKPFETINLTQLQQLKAE